MRSQLLSVLLCVCYCTPIAGAGILLFAELSGSRQRVWLPHGASLTTLAARFGLQQLAPLDAATTWQHRQRVVLRDSGRSALNLAVVHPPDGFVTARRSIGLHLNISASDALADEHCTVQLDANGSRLASWPCRTGAKETVLRGLPLGQLQLSLTSDAASNRVSVDITVLAPKAATAYRSQLPFVETC